MDELNVVYRTIPVLQILDAKVIYNFYDKVLLTVGHQTFCTRYTVERGTNIWYTTEFGLG